MALGLQLFHAVTPDIEYLHLGTLEIGPDALKICRSFECGKIHLAAVMGPFGRVLKHVRNDNDFFRGIVRFYREGAQGNDLENLHDG